jgi:hypothetical protein
LFDLGLGEKSPMKQHEERLKSVHSKLASYLHRAGYARLFDINKSMKSYNPVFIAANLYEHLATDEEALLAVGMYMLAWFLADDFLENASPSDGSIMLQATEEKYTEALSSPPPAWLLQAPAFHEQPSSVASSQDVMLRVDPDSPPSAPASPLPAAVESPTKVGSVEFLALFNRLLEESLAAVHAYSISASCGQGVAAYHTSWWTRFIEDFLYYTEGVAAEQHHLQSSRKLTFKVCRDPHVAFRPQNSKGLASTREFHVNPHCVSLSLVQLGALSMRPLHFGLVS